MYSLSCVIGGLCIFGGRFLNRVKPVATFGRSVVNDHPNLSRFLEYLMAYGGVMCSFVDR